MKYILLIYGDEQAWGRMPQSELERVYAGHRDYVAAMEKAGVIRGGAELQPTTTAKCVRFGKRGRSLTDGPFAETKEQLGGYYVIEVDSIEQAIEWAERMPAMDEGTVEVRPLGME